MTYTIIRDTREQLGYMFSEFQDCAGTEIATMKAGDYTMKGYEHIVVIERKGCIEELSQNVGVYKDRFRKELEKLEKIPHKYLICEFDMDHVLEFPNNSKMLKNKNVRISGNFILRQLMEYQIKYNIHILFCHNSSCAQKVVASIFKRIYELVNVKE